MRSICLARDGAKQIQIPVSMTVGKSLQTVALQPNPPKEHKAYISPNEVWS